MEIINFKDFVPKFTNQEIHITLKYILSQKKDFEFLGMKVNGISKMLLIADLIKDISNKDLLENSLKLFSETRFLSFENNKLETINCQTNKYEYSDFEKTIIKSHYFSNLIEFQLLQKKIQINLLEIKPLTFSLTESEIKSNIDEIRTYCVSRDVIQVADLSNSLSKNERSNFLSKIIVTFANSDLKIDSNFLKKYREYFEIVKNNPITELNEVPNENSHIFHSRYNEFLEYKKHIIEPYVDYSYLFQRMLKEKFIYKIEHLKFAEWLFAKEHINLNILDIIIKNSGFRSLNKSFSDQRCNNFNLIFGL